MYNYIQNIYILVCACTSVTYSLYEKMRCIGRMTNYDLCRAMKLSHLPETRIHNCIVTIDFASQVNSNQIKHVYFTESI